MMKSQCKETPCCPWISWANESSKLQSNFASDVDEAMDSSEDLSLRLGEQCNPEPSTQPFTNCSETQILINPTDSSKQSAASCGETANDLDIDLNNSRNAASHLNCTTQSNTTSASQSMSSSNGSLSTSQSSQSMSQSSQSRTESSHSLTSSECQSATSCSNSTTPARSVIPNMHRASPSPSSASSNQKGSILVISLEKTNKSKNNLFQEQITIDNQRYQVEHHEKQEYHIEQQRKFNADLEERQCQF